MSLVVLEKDPTALEKIKTIKKIKTNCESHAPAKTKRKLVEMKET